MRSVILMEAIQSGLASTKCVTRVSRISLRKSRNLEL